MNRRKELIRRPSRFLTAGGALTLIVVLILLLGGLLDGLYLGSTRALEAQSADAFVYSEEANDSFFRSRLDETLRADVAAVDAVGSVSGLSVVQLPARVPGSTSRSTRRCSATSRRTQRSPTPSDR